MLAQIDWPSVVLPLLVGTIPAVGAAIVAAISATRVRQLQDEAAHVRDLENRLAEKKYEVYEPLINQLGQILMPGGAAKLDNRKAQDGLTKTVGQFVTWISIFGSDEAVQRYHRFMQAAFHRAPPTVAIRCYAELILAARKDMGLPTTEVTLGDLMGMRITDIHKPEFAQMLSLPEADLYRKEGWMPPWDQ